MDDAPPTVFVVDDDVDMRDSLTYLLRSVGIATRSFPTATSFLADYRSDRPGCLVCDVRMPDMSGLELHERLLAEDLPLPVIFMTAYADVPMAVRALKSGAVEFVEKPFHAQTMLERIQRALDDDRRRRTEAMQRRDIGERMQALTDKEREVLAMILEGAPNKAIAAKAEVSERAVEMRRAAIMRKLQVHSLAELIRLVTRYELTHETRFRT